MKKPKGPKESLSLVASARGKPFFLAGIQGNKAEVERKEAGMKQIAGMFPRIKTQIVRASGNSAISMSGISSAQWNRIFGKKRKGKK